MFSIFQIALTLGEATLREHGPQIAGLVLGSALAMIGKEFIAMMIASTPFLPWGKIVDGTTRIIELILKELL
jgi:hypothetical protein